MNTALLISIILAIVLIVLIILYLALSLLINKAFKNSINRTARLMSALLLLQYILGMLSNLYAKIPDTKSYEVFHSLGYISLHTINGTIILLISIVFLVNTIKQHKSKVIALIGHLSILTALVCGLIFVNFGQNNIFSFIMSLAFIVAFIAYSSQAFRKDDTSISN